MLGITSFLFLWLGALVESGSVERLGDRPGFPRDVAADGTRLAQSDLVYPAAPAPEEPPTTPPAEPPPAEPPPAEPPPAATSPLPADGPALEEPDEPDEPAPSVFPRLLAEVHAGSSLAFNGLQGFVPSGGARILFGPRSLDAALGFAVDFDGQGAFVDAGRWDVASTRVRMDGHLGLGDLSMFDARLGLTLGVGARFAQHSAHLPGVRRTAFVIGVTGRAAPEASVPAGPGRFVVMLPVDVTLDMPSRVQGFTPVAAGAFLGYRLEL